MPAPKSLGRLAMPGFDAMLLGGVMHYGAERLIKFLVSSELVRSRYTEDY